MGTAREEQDVSKSGFNEDQAGKCDIRNGSVGQVQTEEECRFIKATATTSDDIIQDLLNDMRNSEKPFSVEDITSTRKEKERKKHKDHKHKKSKKKKKHHSKYDKSRSRSRDRSHSRPRKTKHRKRSQSKNHSHSASSTSSMEDKIMDEPKIPSPVFIDPIPDQISDDDDLPVGADYRTVMKEAKMTINISSSFVGGLDLSTLPSDKPLLSRLHFNAFPLSKETKRDEGDGDIPERRESEVLKKVIAVKGKGDFVPRNLKIKSGINDSPVPPTQTVTNQSEVEPINNHEGFMAPNIKPGSPSEEEFGPVVPPPTKELGPEPISDGELEKEIEREIQEAGRNEKAGKENDRWSKGVENLVDSAIRKNLGRESDKRTRKRRRSRSTSPDTDQEIKARASRSANRIYRRSRSPDRGRDWRRNDRRRSRSRCNRSRRRQSRSHSRDRFRRRSRSRSCSRDRYRIRRSWSRSRSRSRDIERSESCKDKGIDKAKLLAIARKKAQKMQALGISIDQADKNPKSIDDFVSYCQKIQRKQDKEDRREKGETVSSDDDGSDDEKSASNFKHPFGVKAAEPIKINIVNATPIPTKTPQERVLDSSQLRIVFPVSSGAVHKESVENVNGWIPVTKQEPLKTCSIEQKKYVAITSMDAEKARQHAQKGGTSISSLSLPLLPPPPLPPVLTGLGGLLPPPPPPPKLTAFDCLLPPPPPLPPMLIIPSEENFIMSEPVRTDMAAPKDVSRVLAQRAAAQRSLSENPNDFDAIKKLKEADDQMEAWAATKNLPGKFTGSTGLNILKPEELQPQDPRYNAWVRKDMFKTARPSVGGVGMRLMQKMGWRFGEGLGKEGTGNLEPLTLDVKSDRRGLLTKEDLTPINPKAVKCAAPSDVAGKHPVSLVMELCAKRKWAAPVFTCMESGPPNQRVFLWKVVVNGTEYQPISASRSKKDAKSIACQVVLQSLGLVPRDSNLPVLI